MTTRRARVDPHAIDAETAAEFVERYVEAACSPDDPWTSRENIVADGRKRFDAEEVRDAVSDLIESDAVLFWHGLVAPADVDVLRAVVTREADAEYTRSLLVGKANRRIQELEA